MIKLFTFCVLSIANSYNLLQNTIIDKKPFYIYNNMLPMHNECIVRAINTFNNVCSNINVNMQIGGYISQQQIIENPQYNIISYATNDRELAYTLLNGYKQHNQTLLHINKVDIFISKIRVTNIVACYNMLLHELGHAFGLMHNNINGSIMNASIVIDQQFNTAPLINGKPIVPINLHIDDLYGLWLYSIQNN